MESSIGRIIAFLQADADWKGVLHQKKDGLCGVEDQLSTRVLAAVSSSLSPKPQTPVSPHTALIQSTLPPLTEAQSE